MAIIVFTVIVRMLMYPLVKKQLHHTKAIRELQPEIKKIKADAAGDRQKEYKMTQELYKEREINPFASILILLVQIPILIGLFVGLRKIVAHPQAIIDFSYSFLHQIPWMKTLSHDIGQFDSSLFGIINLTQPAQGPKGFYLPAFMLVVGSAAVQYFQSKQLLPSGADSRSLRQILSEAGKGKKADQTEVNAAVGRTTLYLVPFFVLLVSLHLPSALPLYWFVGGLVAIWQQGRILKEDVKEVEAPTKDSSVEVLPSGEKKVQNRRKAKARKARSRRKK
jgi:YidC/Oxa1 family membrane protein insertase